MHDRGKHMLRIQLVGQTMIENDGERRGADELGGTKPRRLLQMLALEPGTPRSKDVLADQLWEGRPPGSWLATIESYVCVLRRRLGAGGGRQSALATTSSGYVIDPARAEVDVRRVRTLLASSDLSDVTTALDLLHSEILTEEPYAPWACAARESLGELVAEAGSRAAAQANHVGRHELAARLARAAVEHSYFSEPAWRELMLAQWQTRGSSEAIRTFERLRSGMLDELGLEPDPRTRALHRQILVGAVGGAPGQGLPSPDKDMAAPDEIDLLLRQLRRALARTPSARLSAPAMRDLGQLLLLGPR